MKTIQERAESIVDTFPYMMKVFHRFGTGVVNDSEMTIAQFRVLVAVDAKTRCTLAELATFLGVKSPAASETVEKLVKSEWLLREANPSNRRQTIVSLSKKGKRYLTQRRSKMIVSFIHMLDQLTEREQNLFEHSLQNLMKIAVALEKKEQQ